MGRVEFEILESFCSGLKLVWSNLEDMLSVLHTNTLFGLLTFGSIKCWIARSQCSNARISYFTSNNNVALSLLNKIWKKKMNAGKEGKGVNLNHVAKTSSSVFHLKAAGAEELLIFCRFRWRDWGWEEGGCHLQLIYSNSGLLPCPNRVWVTDAATVGRSAACRCESHMVSFAQLTWLNGTAFCCLTVITSCLMSVQEI